MLTLTKRRARQGFQVASFLEDPQNSATIRDLYTRVLVSVGVEGQIILGVSSALDGEGKTAVATSLAVMLAADGILAEPGKRHGQILLVECNRGRSVLREAFGIPPGRGLVDHLLGQCPVEDAIKATVVPRLSVLPVGSESGNFPILVRSGTMFEAMQHLRRRFDLVILDLPSLLVTTDTQVLTGLTDHLVLVVRAAVTPEKLVRQALGELDRDKLVGIVLNAGRQDLPHWLERIL